MTTQAPEIRVDRELLEQAAAWRMRIFGEGEPEAADAEAFERWLSTSPRHQAAFDQASTAWDLFEPHASAPEVIRARRDALEYVRRESRRRWASGLTRRGGLRIAASIALAAVLGVSAWPLVDGVDVYRTDLGERREVTLADGSKVTLDSNSRVKVRYTDEARRLTLQKGQARFDVAHNAARPFSVTAGDRRVIATGTAFNIELLGHDVNVTLLEGSVIVAPEPVVRPLARKAAAPKPVPLKAGQQLVAAEGSPSARIDLVEAEDATAWQRGKVVLDNLPLEQAALRINRYSDRKIVVRDPEVAALNVSGVFQAGDPETFARAMAQYLDLQAQFGEEEIILSQVTSG